MLSIPFVKEYFIYDEQTLKMSFVQNFLFPENEEERNYAYKKITQFTENNMLINRM